MSKIDGMTAPGFNPEAAKNYNPQANQDDDSLEKAFETLPPGEWVELEGSIPDLAELLEKMVEKKVNEGGIYKVVYPTGGGKASTAAESVRNALEGVFRKTGGGPVDLKDRSPVNGEVKFKFRNIEPPQKTLKEERVLDVRSYEISVNLAPRYEFQGKAGEYVFAFHIRVLRLKETDPKYISGPEAYKDRLVYVTTLADKKVANKKAKDGREAGISLSAMSAGNAIRDALAKIPASGGAPGSGKRK